MTTEREIADQIINNWLDHYFASHPDRIMQALSEGTLPKHSCRVCESLHAQLSEMEA